MSSCLFVIPVAFTHAMNSRMSARNSSIYSSMWEWTDDHVLPLADCGFAGGGRRWMLRINKVHRMDALVGLSKLPDASVDLVITDPPYNIARPGRSTMKGGKIVSTMSAWGSWDCFQPFDYDLFISKVISECYRVLKSGGALYMFTAREDNGFFIRKAIERGFTYRNQLAIIKKSPQPSFSKANWRSAFELCFYVTKGKAKTFNFLSQPECVNIYPCGTRHKSTKHPTEKPFEMIRRMVGVSSNPGDLVLDPFMGSGTTAAAAKASGRSFLGFELKSEYHQMAYSRLRAIRSVRDKPRSDSTS